MDKFDSFTNKDAGAQPPQHIASKQKEITGLLEKGASSDCIVKVMKPLYGVPEADNNWFVNYYTHHKEKLEMTKSTYDFCLYRSDPLGTVGMQTDDTLK